MKLQLHVSIEPAAASLQRFNWTGPLPEHEISQRTHGTCTMCSFRKFRVPNCGPDQFRSFEVAPLLEAAAGSMLTCSSNRYNTMGFWKNSHSPLGRAPGLGQITWWIVLSTIHQDYLVNRAEHDSPSNLAELSTIHQRIWPSWARFTSNFFLFPSNQKKWGRSGKKMHKNRDIVAWSESWQLTQIFAILFFSCQI